MIANWQKNISIFFIGMLILSNPFCPKQALPTYKKKGLPRSGVLRWLDPTLIINYISTVTLLILLRTKLSKLYYDYTTTFT